MEIMNKTRRKACWDARDRYWQCNDFYPDNPSQCKKLQKLYEDECPQKWVGYFNRKRNENEVRKRVDAGRDPIDDLPDVPKS